MSDLKRSTADSVEQLVKLLRAQQRPDNEGQTFNYQYNNLKFNIKIENGNAYYDDEDFGRPMPVLLRQFFPGLRLVNVNEGKLPDVRQEREGGGFFGNLYSNRRDVAVSGEENLLRPKKKI